MGKELTVREMASMGGLARAARYTHRQLQEFAKDAGPKPKLTDKQWERLFAMLKRHKTHAECARKFGISTRTIGRAIARRKAGGAE